MYLGELEKAFNTMTVQLKERESVLKEEARQEKEKASMDPADPWETATISSGRLKELLEGRR